MDLALYFRVLWRFRVLVLAGFVLGAALAYVSYSRTEVYQADTLLLVTQKGFPWGRTVIPADPTTGTGPTSASQSGGPQYADPTRFESLAVFYAQLANSDPIQTEIQKGMTHEERLTEKLQATASLPDTSVYNGVLPFIDMQGLAERPATAVALSSRGANLLQRYIEGQQAAAGISPNGRVLLEVVKRPGKVLVVSGRKKTLPIAVFLTVLIAAIGAAFVLENLRPRPVLVSEENAEAAAPFRQIA